MIVVSDTTALTSLIKAGMEHILARLFGEVRIPQEVAGELLRFHSSLPDWCLVYPAKEDPLFDSLRRAVDAGEVEAIALAVDLRADFVLLDDIPRVIKFCEKECSKNGGRGYLQSVIAHDPHHTEPSRYS